MPEEEPIYGPDVMAEIVHRIADEIADDDATSLNSLAEWQEYLAKKLAFEVDE